MPPLPGLLLIALFASTSFAQTPDLATRAETTNYEETSSYEDVVRIVNGIER